MMTIRCAIYARTSPDCPISADDQVQQLKTAATERGWTVACVFADHPTSVKKGLDRRPGELALIHAVQSGAVDKVLIWSVCRIGKSLIELIGFMQACQANSVSVYLQEQNVDTDTSNCASLLDLAAMLGLHLRQSRRDRILRGQAAARSLNIRFGRPPLGQGKVEKARVALAAGKGVRQVARLAGISPASVSRLKSAMNTEVASA
jgi:DNA invertase Pin-like site-specific DNA recombinase